VAGVAGNHDDVGGLAAGGGALHLLDTDVVELGGLRVGGVGYIAGNPEKRGRRAEDDQLARLELIAESDVDLLICHEGPSGELVDPRRPSEERDQLGHAGIRALVEEHAVPLTVCGHVHWPRPLARHRGGAILNVDARAVVLVAAR
jgi:Icc-related predicted phosphoesterase